MQNNLEILLNELQDEFYIAECKIKWYLNNGYNLQNIEGIYNRLNQLKEDIKKINILLR